MSWTEGKKFDVDKDPWHLMPVDALRAVVKVLLFGATKYAPRNWEQGIAYSRCYAATLRHLTSWWEGESQDPETGYSHLAHAMCCVMFLLAYELRGMKRFDDRPLQVYLHNSKASSATPTVITPLEEDE